ncbi:MAG TPA: DUF6448 family protein [Kofleriaceae bacterium]
MRYLPLLLCSFLLLGSSPTPAYAHCDTYDGPVVKAGQQALATGDLDFALIWIKPEAENELRAAFKQAQAVRTLSGDARELADRFFLETLVRLHRAGEGIGFTGIKPKGTDLGVAIPAADAALATGSLRALTKLMTDATNSGLQKRFDRVRAARKFKPHDVAHGREYVEAYVTFTHYVEGLYERAATAPTNHAEHGAEH